MIGRDGSQAVRIPVSPSLTDFMRAAHLPVEAPPVDLRLEWICTLAVLLGGAAGGAGERGGDHHAEQHPVGVQERAG